MTQKGLRCALNDAGILSKLCLPNKKPLPFRGGVGGRGFYYAIQLVTPSVVATAVSMLTMS